MSDELTTQSFIAGRYAAPYFTNLLPGQFAPPPPCPPTTVLAGNPLTLHAAAPAGGGNLSLEVYARGDTDDVNLISDETPVSLDGSNAPVAGSDVAWTLAGAFTATLPSDTYPYAFKQSTGSGADTMTTTVSAGSFDVLAVGF